MPEAIRVRAPCTCRRVYDAQTTVVFIAAATSQRICVARSNGRIRCIEKIFPAEPDAPLPSDHRFIVRKDID